MVGAAFSAPNTPTLISILQMKKLSLKEIASFPRVSMIRSLSGEFVCRQWLHTQALTAAIFLSEQFTSCGGEMLSFSYPPQSEVGVWRILT